MFVCPEQYSFVHDFSAFWHEGGWVGVDLFFVLSGFLVSGLLFRQQQELGVIRFWNFVLRRGLKIWPSFWVMIFATVIFCSLFHYQLSSEKLLAELLFVQNYFPGLWPHTWSLAVEEHFYLFLPLLLFLLLKWRNSSRAFAVIPVLTLFISLFCLIMRYWIAVHFHDAAACLYWTHLRFDSLFFGVFLSYLFHFHTDKFQLIQNRFRLPLSVLGVALLLPAFFFPLDKTIFVYTFGFTIFYLGAGMLLVSIFNANMSESRLINFFAFLGSRSYSIYLWHIPVNWMISLFEALAGKLNWFVYALAYLFGTCLVGVYMARLVELPVLKLRDRVFPSNKIDEVKAQT